MLKILVVLLDQFTGVSLPKLHRLGVVFSKYKSLVVHYVVVHHLRKTFNSRIRARDCCLSDREVFEINALDETFSRPVPQLIVEPIVR
jgi:hypothetical protein